jgi:hypothetical protein
VLDNKQLPNLEAQGALGIVLKRKKGQSTKETGVTGSGGWVSQSYPYNSYLTKKTFLKHNAWQVA